jgi:chemotaxis protein methyltransferase CheR
MKATLADADYQRVRALLRSAAGLVFDETRRDSLAYALGQRLLATGAPDVTAYLDLVEAPAGAAERQLLIDEVTIPETYFFRNPPQIRALRGHVLPELVGAAAASRRLVVWSAGCSTGEEPYTVAMLLAELIPQPAEWQIEIVATDVSERSLAAARRGRYGKRSVQAADPVSVGRWFDVEGDEYVVRPEVRAMVSVRHHNLVTDPQPLPAGDVDLVLCRNVTIYFDRDTTRQLMARFHTVLRRGGYLFLGHAETLWRISEDFDLVPLDDAFVYRKAERARPAPRQRPAVLPQLRPRRPVEPAAEPAVVTRQPQLAAPAADLRPASAALRAGRYADAAALAAEVAERAPLLAEAHYLRGLALSNLGRDRDALVTLRKAVYLDPGSGFAHFLLAGALARLGEGVAAARSYRAAAAALGRRPGDAVAEELGGRSVEELAALCHTLAGAAEQATRPARAHPAKEGVR